MNKEIINIIILLILGIALAFMAEKFKENECKNCRIEEKIVEEGK